MKRIQAIALAWAVGAAGLSLTGCGGDGPTHAGMDTIPLDPEVRERVRSSGLSPAPGSGAVIGGSIQDYESSLRQLLSENREKLAEAPEQESKRALLELQEELIEKKLQMLEFAYVEHRDTRTVAHSRVLSFLVRFAPDLEWEANYALQSGDLSLVSELVQDVVNKLRRQSRRSGRPRASGERLDPSMPAEQDVLAAEKLAAEALYRIGKLAEDAADLEEAERNYKLAGSYNPDVGVAADAAGAHASLLRSLGRNEEAAEVQSKISGMLTR